jgi:tetratricopeptide (TPR) repeat protein
MSVLLSAAVIVRDEAEQLDACLASLEGFVDEVVVVDTGSVDDSVDVALRHGAAVGHAAWRGDFATPRNQSLDLASGAWILYIDADERLREGDHQAARQAIADARGHVAFRVRFVPRVGWTPYREYRLWRHRPEIRFEARIHESIVPSICAVAARDSLLIDDTDLVTIDHLGYEGDQRRKHARNEPILLGALEEHPDRIFYYDHLARIYADLGADERAVAMWRRGIEVARARPWSEPDDRLLWVNLIGHQLGRNQLGPDVATLVDEGCRRFPGVPALELAAAMHEFATGAPATAARRLEWITSLTPDEIIATGSAYDERVLGEWAWNLLGLCRFELGNDAGAAEAFRRAEAAAPGQAAYRVRRQLAERRDRSRDAAGDDRPGPAPSGRGG